MNRKQGWAWTGGATHAPPPPGPGTIHRQDGHSRPRATWLATGQGSQPPFGNMAGPMTLWYCDARDQAQNPSGPTSLHIIRPTGSTAQILGGKG